ncbi:CatB-related O-acetyltransferase [Nodularia chucula]|uniref:CatB-related O-acetyltransferase n=1 Tax=Nodularia chucula TaxID=3093667 RepID=UPI0039C6C7F1
MMRLIRLIKQYLSRYFSVGIPPWHPSYLQKRYPQYLIGKASYSPNLRVLSFGENSTLKIGNFCSIGGGTQVFLGGEHRIDWVTTYPFSVQWKAGKNIKGHPYSKGDVEIGNDVWIGNDVVILSGVTIGDGAVIGARSVVAKSIPPYAIAVGNPAKVIRFRFSQEVIDRLLMISWWDWDEKRIENAVPLLCNTNIETFLQAVETSKL